MSFAPIRNCDDPPVCPRPSVVLPIVVALLSAAATAIGSGVVGEIFARRAEARAAERARREAE